jgi:imidazole glycerol-phosphate synthase subunit HisH
MIVIVDYDMGNVGSIHNMLKKIGIGSVISNKFSDIENASKLILPGVGAFDIGMKNLHEKGLFSLLQERVLKKRTPILGICLGMQLMTLGSEEGVEKGLGWLDAKTVAFSFKSEQQDLKVPHMGWNTTKIKYQPGNIDLPLNIVDDDRFYFVHSYYVSCKNEKDVLTTTHYGHHFCSSFVKDHIIGVQFHPEKSHHFGLQLLKSFATPHCHA